jgi:hypothetical protein
MASTQQLLDAKKATSDQRIRELTAQLDKEKAEAEAAVAAEAKAVVEAKVEHQRQEAIRKAKAEAAAKQAESDAIRRQEEANKKARAEIRKGKRKVEGPPAESSATRASTGGLCAQCVAAGKLCAPQGGRRATACKWCTRIKSTCSFTRKDTRPEPAAESNIEIVERPSKRPNVMKPTQGQVMIDIPVSKSKPSGSRGRGVDLSKVVLSMRSLAEVGISIQRELRGQWLAAEAHVRELQKHRKAMMETSKILNGIGTILNEWLVPVEESESGTKDGEEKEVESVMESDTESELEKEKVVEKEVEQEQEPEKEPEKELVGETVAEIEDTMDTSQ